MILLLMQTWHAIIIISLDLKNQYPDYAQFAHVTHFRV